MMIRLAQLMAKNVTFDCGWIMVKNTDMIIVKKITYNKKTSHAKGLETKR